jgi:serine/threonine-protein kinase
VKERQFIIQEMLNESATTTVYKAHQSVLDRTVLLKILHKHLIDDKHLTERFRREAQACALIRSEYIVQVYDLTEIDGAPAIVMEYVEGRSLKDVLAADGPLPAAKARQIVIEILNALRAAHARGVIHRDIKPGNIIVSESGHCKVTDFGLAAISVAQTVTMDGAVLGTPAYLPPEHIRGEAADERSDLFSLGVTAVELLTGVRIFEGASYSVCINKILQFDVGSIDTLIGDTAMADVIRKMMHPDREQRFISAEAALLALHGEPEPLQPTLASAPAARNRSVRSAVLIGAAGVIALLAWLFLRPAGEHARSDGASALPTAVDTLQRTTNGPLPSVAVTPDEKRTNASPSSTTPARGSEAAVKFSEKDSSGLIVTCTPWGKVFLDNQYLGETPLSGVVTVKAGPHTLNFTNPQFLPIVKTFTAASGGQLTVAANFFETAGYIIVTVVPWAEVYIDDQYRDTTPMEKPIIVTAGKRKLRLHNPGFADVVIDVTVPKNDTLRLTYSLTGTR